MRTTFFIVIGAVFWSSLTFAQAIDPIDPIPGGSFTEVTGVSGNGVYVVGTGSSNDTATDQGNEALLWTMGTGSIGLGFLDATQDFPFSTAHAVSDDGATVVGESLANDVNYRAFRWTSGTGMLALVLPTGGFNSSAYGISNDGTRIVGEADARDNTTTFGETYAVYWDDTGVHLLDDSAPFSTARDADADGSVIVGQWQDPSIVGASQAVAFRWTNGGGFESLGQFVAGNASSAKAVNTDGTVVVGYGQAASFYNHAFRWTSGGGLEDIGFISAIAGHNASEAYAVNGAGTVVVGRSYNATYQAPPNYEAFYWDTTNGLQSLADVLTDAGVDLTGWQLAEATGISTDGSVIVGDATDPDDRTVGFIARFDGDGGGVTTPEIIAQSIANLSDLPEAGNDYLDSLLQTHVRGASDCTSCAFAYGFGGTLRGDDPAGTIVVGGQTELHPDVLVGGSVSAMLAETPMVYDGSVNSSGVAATVFAKTTQEEGIQVSAALAAWLYGVDITRGYLSGVDTVFSEGETSGGAVGATVEIGYAMQPAESFMLTPFASLTAAAAHFEGWTETGGPFPASFDDINDTLVLGRLGARVSYQMNDNTLVFASLAWAHRFGDTTTGITGTLLGVSEFDVGGSSVEEDWAEVTAGASFELPQDFTLTASLTASLYPSEATFQVRFGLTHPF